MSITYQNLIKEPETLFLLTGYEEERLVHLIESCQDDWLIKICSKKKQGRVSKIATLEDRIIFYLISQRSILTHQELSRIYNLHNSNVSRILKAMRAFLKGRTMQIKRTLEVKFETLKEVADRMREGHPKTATNDVKIEATKKVTEGALA